MDEDAFLSLCKGSGFSKTNLTKVKKALILAEGFLAKNKRLSGDSYYDHVLRVAEILLKNKADQSTVIASIVQETLPFGTDEKIRLQFGNDVLELSYGVAEIKNIKNRSKQLEAEALKRVILATSKDIRIIVIKLANKLDNLRQLSFLPKEKQERIAKEVLEFYAPLAYRLGMESIRTELENISFAVVNPKKYQQILNYFKESQEQRERNIKKSINEIKECIKGVSNLKRKGRSKHIDFKGSSFT
jgi:GTP diphosphokinase / guanosine-3',5'-bis(diphosphate) 3'-diphosphatase